MGSKCRQEFARCLKSLGQESDNAHKSLRARSYSTCHHHHKIQEVTVKKVWVHEHLDLLFIVRSCSRKQLGSVAVPSLKLITLLKKVECRSADKSYRQAMSCGCLNLERLVASLSPFTIRLSSFCSFKYLPPL